MQLPGVILGRARTQTGGNEPNCRAIPVLDDEGIRHSSNRCHCGRVCCPRRPALAWNKAFAGGFEGVSFRSESSLKDKSLGEHVIHARGWQDKLRRRLAELGVSFRARY